MRGTNNMNKKEPLIDRLVDWAIQCHPIFIFLGATVAATIMVLAMYLPFVAIDYAYGVNGFGPEEEQVITIERLYVDGGESSHYMVGTDKGVYEVSNLMFPVQIWNSDEIYSSLKVGEKYTIKTKGNKILNWYFQEYPYIIEVKEITK
jgi:hypothetical protein